MSDTLTQREVQILKFLAEGLTDREIGQRIGLALNTVKWYNKRIYTALGVNNRAQAASRAHTLGLLDAQTEELATPVSTPPPATNLPISVTSFIGRRTEVNDVIRLVEESRLVTISGPAGCGKTRLALRVAWEMRPYFADGVFFVPLGSVVQLDNIVWTIAEHTGFQFTSNNEPLVQLVNHFKEQKLLLVLDNFEHLTAGAEVLSDILSSTPDVKMLITSRERLNLYGEAVWVLDGMTLPHSNKLDAIRQTEAVTLFVERAKSVNPKFMVEDEDIEHIMRICRIVEGLPLGIELAATWADVLSPEEIRAEIEDSLGILETTMRGAPHAQTSMRAAFDRSWRLLDAEQQVAFRRLAVFRGGFTRETAQAIADVNLRTLQALVAKSLLHTDPTTRRFDVHQLLHHYATEKLEESGESNHIHQAHAAYFADFMAQRWQHLKGHLQQVALREVGADIENVRKAWNFWIKARDVRKVSQFLHSFWVIHDIRGWYPAGIALFEKAMSLMQTISTKEARVCLGWLLAAQGLYYAVGGFYNVEGGYRSGFALTQQGIDILRELKQQGELMIVPLISHCITAIQLGNRLEALEAAQTCLQIASDIGDVWGIAKAKQFLAIQAIEDKSHEQAERLGQEALQIFEQNGDRWSESVVCIEALGLLAIARRELESASNLLHRGLSAAEAINFDYSIQMAYWQLGYIEVLRDDFTKAGEYWQQALDVGGDQILGTGVTIGFGGTSTTSDWGRRK